MTAAPVTPAPTATATPPPLIAPGHAAVDTHARSDRYAEPHCADAWPPLKVKPGTAHYAGDNAAGDTNGEGIGEVWHVARARFFPRP